jgi:hypothetical protein
MEKRFDFLSSFLYWYPRNGKTLLFVIPVCIVFVFWQWKNKLISCLHFCIGILEWKNIFIFYFCLFCIGILVMERGFESMSAFLYLVFWQWKNKLISCLHFCIGILEWKIVFICYSCLRCIGILAMEERFDSLPAFLYLVSWKWKK